MAVKTRQQHINREVSWMAFNERVLQEAADPRNPIIERIRFLGIYSNNMDEFFRVRIASLRRMAQLGTRDLSTLEDDPRKILSQVLDLVKKQQVQYEQLFGELEEALKTEGIHLLDVHELSDEQYDFIRDFFQREVRHNLYPVIVSKRTRFPALEDHAIYFMVGLTMKGGSKASQFAVVQIPSEMPRFVVLPPSEGKQYVMFLDDVIRLQLHRIFAPFNAERIEAYIMKITRDAELDIDEDISKSLLQKMASSVDRRKKGHYVRFLYDSDMPKHMVDYVTSCLGVSGSENVIAGGRYHNRKDLMGFPLMGRNDLCFEPRPPIPHPFFRKERQNIFEVLAKKDVLLHYPYQQFDHVVNLVRESAIDPHVKSIRINLYRIAENSHIANALMNAVKNGIKVTVVLELQARFDEKNNIKWSKRLQEAGATVLHGVPGLKVHSKLLLITRSENRKSVRYCHVGTGNFHEKTARVYSDVALLTTRKDIAKEVKKVFDFFENNYQRVQYRQLLVSPFNARRRFTELIKNEVDNAKKGLSSGIVLKLNNLVDSTLIKRLYDASQAGVQVQLIVRGVCSLVPGVPGLSENIRVTSIVGRFLEHARIYRFENAGNPLFYLGSADWMTRNLDYRVEVTVPVLDDDIKTELDDILRIQLAGNVKARIIDSSLKNKYVPREEGEEVIHSQEELYRYYKAKLESYL